MLNIIMGGDTCCTPPHRIANEHLERPFMYVGVCVCEPKRVYKPKSSLKTIFSCTIVSSVTTFLSVLINKTTV